MPWRTVSKHPAPAAWVVRTALNANISWWRRRRREIAMPDPGIVADPPALPEGAGLWIYDRPGFRPSPHARVLLPLAVGLVQASQQCTGS